MSKHEQVSENEAANERKRANKEARKKIRLQDKEKLLLETKLVAEGKIYPRAHYMPRGRFRGILAVILAFFFGIFIAIGGLIAGGAFLGTQYSVGQVLEMFGIAPDVYEQYIDKEYAKLSVLDLAQDMLRSEYKNLNDIAKYSPYLGKTVDDLIALASDFGVTVEKEKLMSTNFDGLGDYFQNEVLHSVVIGKAAGLKKGDNNVLITLCYGEEGIDYVYNEDGSIHVVNAEKTLTVGDLIEAEKFDAILHSVRLGTLLEINTGITEEIYQEKSMLFALAYGKRNQDFMIDETGKVVLFGDREPTTVGDLMDHPNDVIDGVELGTLLGIDYNVTDEKLAENGVMYSICYGTRGKDYTVTDGTVVMLDGHDESYPTTVKQLTENSNDIIQNMEVETLLDIKPGSAKAMHYLAYGDELAKDESGNYITDEDGNYPTEYIKNEAGEPTDKLQYVGGGRYIYEYDETGKVTGVKMLPDPNDPDGKPYAKRKVRELTAENSDIFENATIGSLVNTDGASQLMQTLKDWTIKDLQSEEKIESLKLGDLMDLDEEEGSSRIMQALKDKTVGDLKNQETIDNLKLGDIMDIREEDDPTTGAQKSADIFIAMKDWTVKDLNNQNRINRLRIGQVLGEGGDSKLMNAIRGWRIGDLTKQEKIDSLTLSSVIDVGDNGILHALGDTPIGEMQSRIDTMRLSEFLSAEDLNGNKILKHLKDSTLSTLADDVAHLTIGDVFADEVYSYMEIKMVDGVAHDYRWLASHYLGKIDETYKTEHKITDPHYVYNYQLEEFNTEDYRPTAIPSDKLHGADGSLLVRTEYVAADGTKLEKGFFAKNGESFVKLADGTEVLFNAAINRNNRGEGEWQTPYYYELRYALTPVYAYYVYDYDKGAYDPDRPYIGERSEDGMGYYYMDGETRVDLEEVLTGYTYEGADYDLDGEGKITWTDGKTYRIGASHELVLRNEAYERFASADGTKNVEAKDVAEKYSYDDGGKTVPLDRYLSGVWYLLLADTGEDGTLIGYRTDTAILEVDSLISGVNSSMQDSKFAELWFRGIIEDNPYANLAVGPWKETGITFYHGPNPDYNSDLDKNDETNNPLLKHTVYNLIEVSLSETVALIQAFAAAIDALPSVTLP